MKVILLIDDGHDFVAMPYEINENATFMMKDIRSSIRVKAYELPFQVRDLFPARGTQEDAIGTP